MFWRKKKRLHMEDVEVHHVPLPALIRQIIYDTMLMPAEGIAEAMGLPPVSDEVAEMEEDASQDRLEKFAFLIPFIDSHADIAARITTAAYVLEDDGEDNLNLGDTESMTKLFRLVALSSSMSCISTLVSLGLITPRKVSHVK